ncbi:hypothetical protein AOCH_001350 [Aspergillus ochraceoroseus]|nr:hypothetical protein AOCH_001350 [Aspergillus ochraceoroseus]
MNPAAQHTLAEPRLLAVDFTSWTGRHLRVTEGDSNGALVYLADLKLRKPHMIFQAEGTARLPATVTFHSFSRTIDVNINGQDIPVRQKGTFKYEIAFESPALGGTVLTWKNPRYLKPFDLECYDENGVVFAKFVPSSSWSCKKAGRIELYQACSTRSGLTDEVVVTGLALAYHIFTQTVAANAGAAS